MLGGPSRPWFFVQRTFLLALFSLESLNEARTLNYRVSFFRSKSSGRETSRTLNERVTRSTVGQRKRFPSGTIPNGGSFRRRQLLDGAVCLREMPDIRSYLEARRVRRGSAGREMSGT